jgi:LysR family glycine cleavage system transcriptional activator
MGRIPSTQSLRVFRKAAETLSFTQTAEELCLTQSAVSHQIKQLEEQLCGSLFIRHRRGLLLSSTGREFLRAVTPILDDLEAVVDSLRSGIECGHLVVRVEPALFVSGLLPMLSELLDLTPDLRLQLEACEKVPAGLLEDRCIAIYLGKEIRDPAIHCSAIASEECFAVCASNLMLRRPLRSFADLQHHRLLLVKNETREAPQSDWETWLGPKHRHLLLRASRAVFGTSALALEAALAGQGIALSRSLPAAPHLMSGRLVRPFARRTKCSEAYFFACAEELLAVPGVKLLRDRVMARAIAVIEASNAEFQLEAAE